MNNDELIKKILYWKEQTNMISGEKDVIIYAIQEAKKEVINDKEFDDIRDTNKFKKIVKRHLPKVKVNDEQRGERFLKNLGHGKSIHEIESEEDEEDN